MSTYDTAALWSATQLATDPTKIGAAGLSVRQRKLLTLLSEPTSVAQLAQSVALPVEDVYVALDRFAKLGLARTAVATPEPFDPMQLRATPIANAAIGAATSRMPMLIGIAMAALAVVAAAAWMLRSGPSSTTPAQPAFTAAPVPGTPALPSAPSIATASAGNAPPPVVATAASPTSPPAAQATASPPAAANTAAARAAAAQAAALAAKAAAVPAVAPVVARAAPATVAAATATLAPAPTGNPAVATPAPTSAAAPAPAVVAPVAAAPIVAAPIATPAVAPATVAAATPAAAVAPARVTPAAAREIKLVTRVEPTFPRGFDTDSGTVRARLQVDARGTVTGVDIVEANPPRVFDRNVRAALQQWRYEPTGEAFSTLAEIKFSR